MSAERPERANPRLREYDYSSAGAYFVTVCTRGRQRCLSSVGRGDPGAPRLTKFGEVAEKYIRTISTAYANVSVENYVIMPDHVHILLTIGAGSGAPGSARPTVSQMIGAWKRFVHKECGVKIFQASFYDHIVRDEEDFLARWKYIDENPARWAERE